MVCTSLNLAKFCHYTMYVITFSTLTVSCYILYLEQAIEEAKREATILTKRSESLEVETPSITICPKPAFKEFANTEYDVPMRVLFSDSFVYESVKSK